MIEISLGDRSNIAECISIRFAAFADQVPSTYNRDEIQTLLQRDETEGMLQMIVEGQFFVAKDHGELVGLAGWRGRNLYNLYVAPSHMRRGIGTQLLACVEEQFLEKTFFDTMHVDAGTYTRPFYESQGYKVVNEALSSDGLAYLEMQKRLR